MPNSRHHGVFSFELKSAEDTGRIVGLASVFGVLDRQGEVVEKGAFTEIIKNAEGKIPVLWQHDTRSPVGVATVAEDEKGLRFDGQLVMEDPAARVALAHVKAGSTRGMSIGYDVIKDEIRAGIRYLKELRLYEISLCVFGANPEAYVSAKSAAECSEIGDWERILRTHGVSKRKARRMALNDWPIINGADPDTDDDPEIEQLAEQLKTFSQTLQGK